MVANLLANRLTGSPIDAIRMSLLCKALHSTHVRCEFRTGPLEIDDVLAKGVANTPLTKKYTKQMKWSPCGRYLIGSVMAGCLTVWSTEIHGILRHLVLPRDDEHTYVKLDTVSSTTITAFVKDRVTTWSLPSFHQIEPNTDLIPNVYTNIGISRGMLIQKWCDVLKLTRLATNETYRLGGNAQNVACNHDATKLVAQVWRNGPYFVVFDLNARHQRSSPRPIVRHDEDEVDDDDIMPYIVASMSGETDDVFEKTYFLANRSNRAIITNKMYEPCLVKFDTGAIGIEMFSHTEFRRFDTCAWSRDDKLLAVSVPRAEHIYVMVEDTREIIHRIKTQRNIDVMCFSPDSRRLAVLSSSPSWLLPRTQRLDVIDLRSETFE